MARVSAYWRPSGIEEALELLARPGAVVMGGGTRINSSSDGTGIEVVDLQDLHLDRIERLDPRTLMIGATTTLQRIADSDEIPASVRQAARRELPSTLRNQATLGGCVMTRDPESGLQAALLVHDAVVCLAGRSGPAQVELTALLADPSTAAGRIVTAVTMRTDGAAAAVQTARTVADRAIVAAFARRASDGSLRLALTGVAATPVLLERAEDLNPAADFRGSAEYRRSLAGTLAGRVLKAIE